MLRLNRGFALILPMTSQQNQSTMTAIFQPGGLPGKSPRDHREDHL
jgi:hypothetical protein